LAVTSTRSLEGHHRTLLAPSSFVLWAAKQLALLTGRFACVVVPPVVGAASARPAARPKGFPNYLETAALLAVHFLTEVISTGP